MSYEVKEIIKLVKGPDNNHRLHLTMTSHGISRRWVARNLYVHLSTVDRWLQPPKKGRKPNPTYRSMPDSALKLFEYSINDESLGPLYRNPPDDKELNPRSRTW